MLYKIKDNEVLCQLTVKPKANVSCQLKFWPFISCQLTASIPSFDGKTLCWISNWIQRSIQENTGSKRKLQSIIIKVGSWRLYNVFNQQDQKSFSTVWSLIKRSLRLLSLVNIGLHAAIIRLSPLIHEGEQRYKPYIVGDPRMVSLSVTPLLKNPGYAPVR